MLLSNPESECCISGKGTPRESNLLPFNTEAIVRQEVSEVTLHVTETLVLRYMHLHVNTSASQHCFPVSYSKHLVMDTLFLSLRERVILET